MSDWEKLLEASNILRNALEKFIEEAIPVFADVFVEAIRLLTEYYESNEGAINSNKNKYPPVKKISPVKTYNGKKIIYRARSNC